MQQAPQQPVRRQQQQLLQQAGSAPRRGVGATASGAAAGQPAGKPGQQVGAAAAAATATVAAAPTAGGRKHWQPEETEELRQLAEDAQYRQQVLGISAQEPKWERIGNHFGVSASAARRHYNAELNKAQAGELQWTFSQPQHLWLCKL